MNFLLKLLRASVAPWLLLSFVCANAQETSSLPTEIANADKGKTIIERSIKALGGDAYLNVFDWKQTGRGFGFFANEPTGVGLSYTRFWQAPDKELFAYFKEQDWRILHIGDQGWETTFRGTRVLPEKENADYNRRRQYGLHTILREWAKDAKTQFFYEGTTLVGAKMAHQVSLLSKDNLSATLFIDMESFLPVRKQYQWRDEKLQMQLEEQELYDEYHQVQGIMTPFKVTLMKQGEIISQRFVKTMEYNVGLGNNIFAIPQVGWDKKKK